MALPTTITGGIGVTLNLYNLRETMAALDILDQSVRSGNNIDMGTTVHAHTEEASKLLRELAREFHQRFEDVVLGARPGLRGPQAQVFDGRVLSGRKAHELGLVDDLGDLDDALALAGQLAGCGPASVVMYRRENEPAASPYGVTVPLPFPDDLLPVHIPGLDRKQTRRINLPLFLYAWLPDPA